MQPITPNPTTIVDTKPEARNKQQEKPPIDKHISDIQKHLYNNTISKTLIERKINTFETLYPVVTNYSLFKNSLKTIEALLRQRYEQKTYINISFNKSSEQASEIQDEKSFEKLNPLVTQKCTEADKILQQINQDIQQNNLNKKLLCEKQKDLTEIDNSIHHLITNNNDITVADLLVRLHETIEKINNAQDTIKLLLQKEDLSSKLQSLTLDSTDQTEKVEDLRQILESEENFDVFENFNSIYKQFMKNFLLSINDDPENFDYDLEITKIKDKNTENKTITANKLKLEEAVKKTNILKDKIITLAEKLESMNDVKCYNDLNR